MGLFGDLFGNSNTSSKKKNNLSQKGGVFYNDDLIIQLTKDHKKLTEDLEKIIKATQNKKYKILKQYLKTFKTNLEIHNYSEKIQLYAYLKKYYKDTKYSDFIEEIAKSAEELHKETMDFLKKYEKIELDNQSLILFQDELGKIDKFLQSRIEIEENELYPLYKQ